MQKNTGFLLSFLLHCCLRWQESNVSRLTQDTFSFYLVSSLVIRQYNCALRLHRNKKVSQCQVEEFLAFTFFRKVKCGVCSKADALQKRTQARREKAPWKTVIGSNLITLRWQELSESAEKPYITVLFALFSLVGVSPPAEKKNKNPYKSTAFSVEDF